MSFIEFLGFIISLIALAVVSARKAREERKRRENPELYEKEQEDRRQSLQNTLREMHIEIEGGPPLLDRERAAAREDDDFDEEDDRDEVRDDVREERPAPPPARPPQPIVHKPPTRMLQRNYDLSYKLKRFQQVRPIDQRKLVSALQLRRIGRDVTSRDMAADMGVDAYTQKRAVTVAQGRRLVNSLHNPRDMVILNAIWERPKGWLSQWS